MKKVLVAWFNLTRLAISFLLLVLVCLFVFAYSIFFPNLPEGSYPTYVCRDVAEDTQKHFASYGIDSTIVVGDLSWMDEAGWDTRYYNHVWVIVHFPIIGDIAYDWGQPKFSSEYYTNGQ